MKEVSIILRGPWTAFVLLILGIAALCFVAETAGFENIAKTYQETEKWLICAFAVFFIMHIILSRK